MCVKRNRQWRRWTYRHFYHDVTMAAKSLLMLGLDTRHGVCIIGFNSPEWFISYFGTIMVSGWLVNWLLCAHDQVVVANRKNLIFPFKKYT